MIGLLVTVAILVVVGALTAGVVVLAGRSKENFVRSNQVVPDRPTRAPTGWLGSHDPEAVLHRRLIESMKALRANTDFDDDGGLLDLRVELEQQAVAIDDRLVAIAALPRLRRGDPLDQATRAVDLVETAVSELAARSAAEAEPALNAVVDRIRERTTLIDQIRAELDSLPAPATEPATAPESGPVGSGPVESGPVESGPVETGSVESGPDETGPGGTGSTGEAGSSF